MRQIDGLLYENGGKDPPKSVKNFLPKGLTYMGLCHGPVARAGKCSNIPPAPPCGGKELMAKNNKGLGRRKTADPEGDDRKNRWRFGQNFLVDQAVIRQIAEDV